MLPVRIPSSIEPWLRMLGIKPRGVEEFFRILNDNTPAMYYFLLLVAVATVLTTIIYADYARRKEKLRQSEEKTAKRKKKKQLKDLLPEDEATFVPNNPNENQTIRNRKYKKLNADNPTRQINEFLGNKSDDEDETSGSEGKEPEDPKPYLTEEFMDDVETECQIDSQESLISRVKKARQRTIRKKLEEDMTEKDVLREKMIQNQQMEKIYSLLAENEHKFGKMTREDIQGQMSMYRA